MKRYYDFTLSRTGVRCDFTGPYLSANFKLAEDVSTLFPYINAIVEGAQYYGTPEYIRFGLDKYLCTLYPKEVFALSFSDMDEALAFIKQLFFFLDDLGGRKESLVPNHKKTASSVPVIDIYKLLPKTNCRKCGFNTCLAFAAFLGKGRTFPEKCPYLSRPISEKVVYPVYDTDGTLLDTVAIEIDSERREYRNGERKKHYEQLEQQLSIFKQQQKKSVEAAQKELPKNLTQREIEVLRLIAGGATNSEISDILIISPHTVKSHVINIFNKLGVNDRTQAAVWAAHHKLV